MFSQLVQKQKEERAEQLWQEFLRENTAIETQIANIQELNKMLERGKGRRKYCGMKERAAKRGTNEGQGLGCERRERRRGGEEEKQQPHR